MGGGHRGRRQSHAATRDGGREAFERDRGKTLDQYSDETKPRVFIIFHHADKSKVTLLRVQAENSETMEFKDTSLKKPVENVNWKSVVADKIAESDQVIVAVGEDTAERKAVKWEIMEAMRQGKPVIAVRLNSDKKDPLPEPVKEEDTVIWNLEDIQDEIDKNKRGAG